MYTTFCQVKLPWHTDWMLLMYDVWRFFFFFFCGNRDYLACQRKAMDKMLFFFVAWIKLTVSHCQQKLLMSTIIDFILFKENSVFFFSFYNLGLIFWVLAATVYDNILLTKWTVEIQGSSDVARHCQVVKYWIFFKTLQRLSHPYSLINYRQVSCSGIPEGHILFV